jgi:hypothetical protein
MGGAVGAVEAVDRVAFGGERIDVSKFYVHPCWKCWRSRKDGRGGTGVGERGHTRVTLVGVRFESALGDPEIVSRDDLVQRVFTTAQDLAGAAMAARSRGQRGGIFCRAIY